MDKLEQFISSMDYIFSGEMGIKQVYKGTELIFNREGPYFYLEFDHTYGTTEENNGA